AKSFEEKYFSSNEESCTQLNSSDSHPALNVLNRLTSAIDILDKKNVRGLEEIKSVLMNGDISSFELIHSGLVNKLIHYLTHHEDGTFEREKRLRAFLHVFMSSPIDSSLHFASKLDLNLDCAPMSSLVSKL